MNIISKTDAKEQGLKRYFTGKPCKNGHLSERYTSGSSCLECMGYKSSEELSLIEEHKTFVALTDIRVIPREKAKELGLPRYFTGIPCKHGHISERYTSVIGCVECGRLNTLEYLKNPENKDKIRQWDKNGYERNREQAAEYKLIYYQNNKDRILKEAKIYRKLNPHKLLALNNKRRADRIQRTPSWSNLNEIRKFYKLKESLTLETGIPHVVDHIIPLRGKLVSGLHVPENLQVITAKINSEKSNKFNIETYNA